MLSSSKKEPATNRKHFGKPLLRSCLRSTLRLLEGRPAVSNNTDLSYLLKNHSSVRSHFLQERIKLLQNFFFCMGHPPAIYLAATSSTKIRISAKFCFPMQLHVEDLQFYGS